MWRPNEPVEEDVSSLAGIDPHSKHRRSRRRGWRDGLADQTVVKTLEDVRSYRAFERTLISSVDPRTLIELELAHRLASLLWRLHRATAIETGLFEIQSEFQLTSRQDASRDPSQRPPTPTRANGHKTVLASNERDGPPGRDEEQLSTTPMRPSLGQSKSRAIAQCFLRLSNLDPTLLDRVGSYEARLWRQVVQTIWTLDAIRRPPPALTRRPFRKPMTRFCWAM
jgi:hypothetical protein